VSAEHAGRAEPVEVVVVARDRTAVCARLEQAGLVARGFTDPRAALLSLGRSAAAAIVLELAGDDDAALVDRFRKAAGATPIVGVVGPDGLRSAAPELDATVVLPDRLDALPAVLLRLVGLEERPISGTVQRTSIARIEVARTRSARPATHPVPSGPVPRKPQEPGEDGS